MSSASSKLAVYPVCPTCQGTGAPLVPPCAFPKCKHKKKSLCENCSLLCHCGKYYCTERAGCYLQRKCCPSNNQVREVGICSHCSERGIRSHKPLYVCKNCQLTSTAECEVCMFRCHCGVLYCDAYCYKTRSCCHPPGKTFVAAQFECMECYECLPVQDLIFDPDDDRPGVFHYCKSCFEEKKRQFQQTLTMVSSKDLSNSSRELLAKLDAIDSEGKTRTISEVSEVASETESNSKENSHSSNKRGHQQVRNKQESEGKSLGPQKPKQ